MMYSTVRLLPHKARVTKLNVTFDDYREETLVWDGPHMMSSDAFRRIVDQWHADLEKVSKG
jgi:hypothetical protein